MPTSEKFTYDELENNVPFYFILVGLIIKDYFNILYMIKLNEEFIQLKTINKYIHLIFSIFPVCLS